MSVGADSDGRRYVRIEPDIRHAELVLRDLGLEGSKAKPLTTPGFQGRYGLGRTSEVFGQVDGKANARKSRGSREGCTLLVGDQTLGSSFVATNVSEVHFNLR